MPNLPRMTAIEAQWALEGGGFELLRTKGSQRIYGKGALRVTVPFHGGAVLHPKIVKQMLEIVQEAGQSAATEQ